MCKAHITGDDSQRRVLAQHGRCNVGTVLKLFATMLQRCVVLKIAVANRLV